MLSGNVECRFRATKDDLAQCHCHDVVAGQVTQEPADASIAEFKRPPAKYSATSTQTDQPNHKAKNCVGRRPNNFAQSNKKRLTILPVPCQP